MEHLTIQRLSRRDICDSSNERLGEWVNNAINTTDISLESMMAIVNTVKQELFTPVPPFIFDFILAFFKHNYSSIDWLLIESAALGQIIEDCENTNALIWSFNDTYHCACLSDRQKELLTDTLTAFDGGVETEYMQGLNIEDFNASISNINGNSRRSLAFFELIKDDMEIVPLTSATLGISESTARFSDAIWFSEIQKKSIIVAGCGGIGSYVIFLLSRMQPRRLFIYDDDVVEMVNMAGQLYSIKDIGKHKVDAIAAMVQDYAIYNSTIAVRERFTASTEALDIMICGFDNMTARNLFFTNWINRVRSKPEEERKHCLFIDGRLAAEEFQVFCIRGDDEYNIGKYASEFLFSDDEADATQCSYKQTTYMANMIGSIMVNLFTNFVANEIVEGLRELPFFTSYSADSMMFKTVY